MKAYHVSQGHRRDYQQHPLCVCPLSNFMLWRRRRSGVWGCVKVGRTSTWCLPFAFHTSVLSHWQLNARRSVVFRVSLCVERRSIQSGGPSSAVCRTSCGDRTCLSCRVSVISYLSGTAGAIPFVRRARILLYTSTRFRHCQEVVQIHMPLSHLG